MRATMAHAKACALRWRTLKHARYLETSSSDDRDGQFALQSSLMPYVLIVDDEASIRDFLTRWLQAWGYSVKTASDADQAITVMSEDPASIMLCDVMMPGRDGLALLTEVRQRWPKTAVIMATGMQDLQTVIRSRADGAVDYVTKPFGREPLQQALRRAEERLQG
jgi:DNA-binding NtrC family response regulator